MYRHILIATDGSATADKAVSAGIEYAREAHARVTLFTAVPQQRGESEMLMRGALSAEELERRTAAQGREVLGRAAARARRAGIDFDLDCARSGYPAGAIVAAAREHACDAIFMASRARTGLSALWYGSQAEDVLTSCDIPTLVLR
ncbi:MAG TPA: universal stress protein [Burkholderiales bacterium]